eukprot:Selendium_serpulae@DN3285_c0_g1_i1.p1
MELSPSNNEQPRRSRVLSGTGGAHSLHKMPRKVAGRQRPTRITSAASSSQQGKKLDEEAVERRLAALASDGIPLIHTRRLLKEATDLIERTQEVLKLFETHAQRHGGKLKENEKDKAVEKENSENGNFETKKKKKKKKKSTLR